eukprot:CAMPEP_0119033698 /NCGR_PEP_ID=MMETSP1177-20130426/752_1 /TAXON_ID=2985 /ORGANISM="Ochromonas sp, Strain CCMP1899" /LENGTH=366 /DNA_ID=CAMNT_0006990637 /DNA_START=148 /DNA_END=1248 /DNA_ORIENTATION=-
MKRNLSEEDEDDHSVLELPIIELSLFLKRDKLNEVDLIKECKKVAEGLHEYSCIIVRDPRVSATDNDDFLDMMERYFSSSDGIRDARPEYHYQVGVTPSHVECPRNHSQQIEKLTLKNKPLTAYPPTPDLKWRFFWRIGPIPEVTNYPLLNMDAVIPLEIPEWRIVMDTWGSKMLNALNITSEMAAIGFGLPTDTFTSRLKFGSHLLAPTGSDFSTYNQLGTVLAGYHYDLNFLTIHGKSRFPGLFIWTRKGRRVAVAVPDGCLLIQAGKQLEYMTGGHVSAGFHEVAISSDTIKAIERRKEQDTSSLWRISSTLFGHIQSDQMLEPLPPFKNLLSSKTYPPIRAGDQVREELQAIALAKSRNNVP